MAQLKDLLVLGPSRFLGNIYGTLKGNADTATDADKIDGYHFSDLESRYVNVTGDTMSGSLIMNTANNVAFDFRPQDSYHTTLSYQTAGNEALVLGTKNAVTSFIVANGEDSITNHAADRWYSITPGLQVKNNCVSIGELIANGVTPAYKLQVNGSTALKGYLHFKTDSYTGDIMARAANNKLRYELYSNSSTGTLADTILRVYTTDDDSQKFVSYTFGKSGNFIANNGLLATTSNGNTVTIGSQNSNWCHIYNSANIPFIFNNTMATTSGGLGTTTYPWNDLYVNLTEGTSDFSDNTELLTSYATNNGFADSNAKYKVYRRDAICMYNYIKNKASGTWGISITGSSASCTGNAATATNADTLDGVHLNGIAAAASTTLEWNTEKTIATIGGNAIKVKLPANPNTNTAHTTFAWTNGTTAGPTGSLSGNHTAVSFGAIPSASSSTSGIVTTGAQTFAGDKTFTGVTTIKRNIIRDNSTPINGDLALTALGYKTGYPVYTDPIFTSGINSIGVYNNNASNAPYTTVDRVKYSDEGIASPGTGSDYVIRIQNKGTGTTPGLGGFVQTITSRANAQFIQIFRALIPTGYTLATASNTMGTSYKDEWITSIIGTGKWEWYARRVLCGSEGSFSSGGHVYLNGTAGTSSAPVKWYLSYCNVYDITKAQYDGLRVRYADECTGNSATATKLATARTISLTGAVTGSGSFDGSGDLSIATTTNHNHDNRYVYDKANISGNMNTAATWRNAMGMINLSGTDATINPNGQTSWHHFINMSYQTESTNMWQTQIANKAGTTDLWVRSRAGGTVTDGTPWAAPWTKILTTANYGNHTHTNIGDGGMALFANNNNEVNFGGTNTSSTIYFGYRATGSKPIPTKFIMGGTTGSAEVVAVKFTGNVTGNVSGSSGSCTGNAATATEFSSNATVALTGDVTGSASAKKGWSIATTLANSGVTAGSYGPSANATPAHGAAFNVPYITIDAKGRVTSASTKTITLPTDNNTDTKVNQSVTTTDNWRKVLLHHTSAAADADVATETDVVYAAKGIEVQPSTGTFKANAIKIAGTTAVKHLEFSREGYNYITTPAGGTLAFILNGAALNAANAKMVITDGGNIYPGTDNTGSMGTANHKWATVYGTKVYGAVWNDYAEYRQADITEPGRCVIEVGNDTLTLSTERLQRGCEIISDTFGFAIGETDECKTPIAASGRVLAYPYEDREKFASHIGWPVCSGPNGTVSIMTEEEEERYPSRIIGTISAVPNYEEWGTGKVKVNGRVWIRIK